MSGCCEPGGPGILHGELDEVALTVAAAGFKALWAGVPVAPVLLLPTSRDSAAAVVEDLAVAGRAEVDDQGLLVGIHGLTLRATRHSFEHAGVVRHTWCAFDSVGIPVALGLDAEARTTCHACGAAIAVAVSRGQVEPSDVVLWLPAPEVTQHLMNDFCATADLYCSVEHLNDALDTAASPGQAVLTEEAAELGRATWADVADTTQERT